jgi:AAA domain
MATQEKLPNELYAAHPIPPRTEYKKPETFSDLLQEAAIEQSAAKVGIFGLQGTGKSTLAALLAIGLSKTHHGGAPVAYHDTENGSDFLKPLFDMEGVKLLVRKSKCFADAAATLHEAKRRGCCAFIEDSITGDWDELTESFKKKKGISKIELYHWGQIKPQWNEEWVTPMLNSPLHVITCGRAGDVWQDVDQEDGSQKAQKVGTKMRAEGQFGYEPSLLIEMLCQQNLGGRRRKNAGRMLHSATVLKDRARFLNGKTFEWPDINTYKAGEWKKFYEAFAPHFNFLNIAGGKQIAVNSADSQQLFDGNGNSDYHQRKQAAIIALEEIEGTLTTIWPGQDAKSKKFKAMAIDVLFGTRSWTKVTTLPQADLDAGLIRLRAIEQNTKSTPMDEEEVVATVLQEAMGKTVAVPANVSTA